MTHAATNRPPAAASTNAPAAELRDIKPPVRIATPRLWLWLSLGGLLGLLLAALAWWTWQRRRRPARPTIVIPPHVHARNRLREALAFLHDADPFCTRVSAALRTYLEDRFTLHAPERTTDEFLAELRGTPVLNSSQKEALGEFLSRCDLVKFARQEPTETELRALWDTAMRLVDQTAYEAPPGAPMASPDTPGRTPPPLDPKPSPSST